MHADAHPPSTQPSDTALPMGALFEGRYEILAELGSGSFGRVFKARQRSTGQLIAVKVLRVSSAGGEDDLRTRMERLRREIRVCAELSHPNIVRLIDSGETADGKLYAAFEFVPGATLKDLLVAEGQLGVAEAVHLMTQVLDALSCAHAGGIVHRDLKPENIMITKTGARRNAQVLDFGLGGFAHDAAGWTQSRITATHELLGTPCYASPEQLRGEPPSARSDLYSWGLVFLECVTGELPVRGASAQEVIMKQLGIEPVTIPQWLRNHPLGRVLELVTSKRSEKRDIAADRLLRMLTTIGIGDFPEPAGARPDGATVERERRQLTIVCCRLTVSASNGRQPDVEEIDQLLEAHRGVLAERAARAGGAVATSLADRVFVVFGYPQAREDDARRAARLAVTLAAESAAALPTIPSDDELRVRMRVGVHTGLVIVRDLRQRATPRLHELTGVTPQIASHLVDRAEPGEILVSLDAHDLLRHEFEFEPAGECTMSELSHALPVFRLTAPRRNTAGVDSRAGLREAPFVGRVSQLQQLHDGWTNACDGRSSAVVITGEAGIGKSRLLHELRQQVGVGTWLECDCTPENQTAPLRPVIDLLLAMDRSIESLLTRCGLDLAENLPLFATLLSIPLDDRYEPLHLSPERHKELTLQALVTLLFRRAEQGPLVLAVENLHWADPATLELIGLWIQELRAARAADPEAGPKLFLLFTTRADFTPPWAGEDVAFLPLQRLTRADVEEMIKAVLPSARALPPSLLEQVVQRTDGVPLFIEELTRLLLKSAESVGSGSGAASLATGVQIPASLRDLLTARLDGVSSAACETAQLAAVLGREFQFDLLRAVSPKDLAFLREDMTELGRAGLVFHRRTGGSDAYMFRHALLRDAAYETMTRATRQGLHRRVAHVLRQQFPDIEERRPEIVALHLEQGGDNTAAAEYWRRAGDQALRHAEYLAAQQQLERGLGLLTELSKSPERTRLEIELLTTLGTVRFSSQGYAVPEVEETFARAWKRCEELGEDIAIKVLNGIWSVHLARNERDATAKLVPRFQRLTERADEIISFMSGQSVLGIHAFYRGAFPEARERLAVARELYGTAEFQRFRQDYGYDGGLYCHAYEISALWNLGYPDQAEALHKELQAIAEASRDPFSICIALGYGETLAHHRGEVERALELSERLTALATEQHLYLWLAAAACGRGGALRQQGKPEEAIAALQHGLTLYQAIGVYVSYAYYLTYLGAAYLDAGRTHEGLAIVDEGLGLCETQLARFHESDLWRLKGELLLREGDSATAETCLRRALDVARQQNGKSYELRAAMSLGALWAAQHRRDEARSLLQGVYGWFREGLDTKDLRDARALLTQLA